MTREGSTRDSGETAQQARSEGREPDREAARPTSVGMTQDTPSIAASEGDWIEWKGGECPVDPGTIVEPKYAADADPGKGTRIDWPVPAGRLAWNHDGEDDDIIAYRIVRTALQEQSK